MSGACEYHWGKHEVHTEYWLHNILKTPSYNTEKEIT